ncbi:hypothetical protein MtrunA17_Chr8g0378591 [Medicago truncatula]|uniref:Uncharacterized protein n=1 Tax=Medicago truncatula TaxID=3880 RepID=A0A396GN89_MEDTR|nr:hypothetical protein MtrunA17_Chr8g0378591 [Medicago truncatula]
MIAILSSCLLGWELGCKQQSAILSTEPGSQVPPCFDWSEDVSKMQFGGSTKEIESSFRTRDQYTYRC